MMQLALDPQNRQARSAVYSGMDDIFAAALRRASAISRYWRAGMTSCALGVGCLGTGLWLDRLEDLAHKPRALDTATSRMIYARLFMKLPGYTSHTHLHIMALYLNLILSIQAHVAGVPSHKGQLHLSHREHISQYCHMRGGKWVCKQLAIKSHCSAPMHRQQITWV